MDKPIIVVDGPYKIEYERWHVCVHAEFQMHVNNTTITTRIDYDNIVQWIAGLMGSNIVISERRAHISINRHFTESNVSITFFDLLMPTYPSYTLDMPIDKLKPIVDDLSAMALDEGRIQESIEGRKFNDQWQKEHGVRKNPERPLWRQILGI